MNDPIPTAEEFSKRVDLGGGLIRDVQDADALAALIRHRDRAVRARALEEAARRVEAHIRLPVCERNNLIGYIADTVRALASL